MTTTKEIQQNITKHGIKSIHMCKVCGHLEYNKVPGACPVCWTPKENFETNDEIFTESIEKSPEAEIKHLPWIQLNKTCGIIKEETCWDAIVKIGKTLHPMTDSHFINWIDCYVNNQYVSRLMLTSQGIFPGGLFHLKETTGRLMIVSHCNLHGYWMKTIDL